MKDHDTPPQSGQRRIDWGHLALLLLICGVVVTYLLDARATSLKINNLLLVEPAAIIALILAAFVLPQCFRRKSEDGDAAADSPPENWHNLAKVAALAAAFGAFALSLEVAGFDVATFLFVALGLYICGERKLWVIALFSAVFTLVIVYGYQMLVPYPFPLRIL
ncbi:tripartite tricarboxylate transporter TctB family protein [Pelagibius sp. 7325]|uniref:tripartite tricarboxylate transporter TctB family protein n=1 Tax=Pelagibius sp. 7325 TaxID=3131994 RepID=UPI0030EEE493